MRSSISRCVWAGLAILVCCAAAPQGTAADLVSLYLKAVERDPAFQAARAERQISDEALRESWSYVRPSIFANVADSWTHQNIKQSESPLFTVGTSEFFTRNVAVSLAQPLFRSQAFSRIPEARAGVRKGQSELTAAGQDVMYRVAEAVFNFLAARDDVAYSTAERESIGRQLEETEQRLGSGLAKLTEVHEARGRFGVAEAAEIDAQDRLEEAREAIREITGDRPEDLKVLSEGMPLVPPDSPDVEAWLQTAMFRNPRILALTAAVDAAREGVRVQKGAYAPTLDLVASYTDNNTGGTVFGGGNNITDRELALRLAIPIYDGGRTSAQVATAALRQTIAEQELEREKRSVDRRTRTSFQGVVSGVARVEALAVSVLANEAAVAGKEEGWRSGLNTGLAVLDARRDLFFAQRNYARARYLYVLSRLKLKQTVGTLDFRDLEAINAYLQ